MDTYMLIVIFHVFFIVPLLLWVGFSRAATPDWAYKVLFGLGVLLVGYHGYKAVVRLFVTSPALWVNLIHVFIVAPLLLWIGYYEKKTERAAYDMLLMVAFGAFGFHLYKLIVISQTFVKSPDV
jgi:hypothetical protein